ncbi:MAG: twin-arginine translocase TatA/TatE family subunit [Bacteroidia bacterium]|nr:twin-arginine translocase TatA/TatE family subunit [Bacteroidia bacterium]
MFGLGTGEIILILLVILVFFGAKRIPELAKGLGKGIREFKDASQGIQNSVRKEIEADVETTKRIEPNTTEKKLED